MRIGQGLLLKRISYWICRGFYGNPHKQRTLSIQANSEDILKATLDTTLDHSQNLTLDNDFNGGDTGLPMERKRQLRPGGTLDETLETTLGKICQRNFPLLILSYFRAIERTNYLSDYIAHLLVLYYILDGTMTVNLGEKTNVEIGTDADESEEPLLLGTARGRKGGDGGKGRETEEDRHQDSSGHYAKRNVHFGKKKANTHDAAV